jgi:ferric-dicitrate binding protein FerR (iron transport regulator)
MAAEWRIAKMSGDVRIFQDNVTWVSLNSDRTIKPGDSIWTGHNGRVMLTSEDGRVLLKPRSLVKIPEQYLPENQTVLFQSMGTVEAEVEKRDFQHFSIQSPYLAAVVKGTKFSLEIKDGETRLDVQEGLVEATDTETGQMVAVAAGQHVSKVNGAAAGLRGNAPGATPEKAGDGPGGTGEAGQEDSANSGGGDNGKSYAENRDNGQGKKLGHFKK